MGDISVKERLIEACISRQKQIAEEAEKAARELQEQVNAYGQNKDRYDSFRTKLTRSKEQLQVQQLQAMNACKALYQISKEPRKQVEHGAVVITDKQCFFIAVGLGKLEMDGCSYYVISALAPIYEAMKGKKEGETFTFNTIRHTIKTIL